MIEKILPAPVSSAEAFADAPDAELIGAEAAIVAKAVDKRRREFATGRKCARDALGKLGVSPVPILTGERGAPLWPAGIVGSITHCDGYRAAVVARASDLAAIGVDAEPNEPLPEGVLDPISLPAERDQLTSLSATAPDIRWDRLLFCAKETVYKAWFPLARRWLGFEEAEVRIDASDGSFAARLLVPAPAVSGVPLTGFTGRWLVSDGLIVTAITVAAG